MNILIACEFSGIVRDAFIKQGHNAISCDLLPTEKPGPHIIGDVIPLLDYEWDMIIAFPPCTYLCNSGVRWLYNSDKSINKERWFKLNKAYSFFNMFKLYTNHVKKIAIENPIMHKHARKYIGKYSQIIQPWQYGHGETKSTCLWLKGLPKLTPTNIVDGRKARIHRMAPSKNRSKLRSITFTGIAAAMAEQWGNK